MENLEDENQMIDALIRGDTEAFRAIYELYAPRLKAYTLRFQFKGIDCDDIVQETFKRVWEKRDAIHAWKNFNTYLISIAKHLIYNQLRHEVYVKKYESEFLKLNASIQENDNSFDIQSIIEGAIIKLPVKCRNIYKLSRIDGFTNPEIAVKLNLSISTVENQLNKALNKIRSALSQAGYSPIMVLFLILFFS